MPGDPQADKHEQIRFQAPVVSNAYLLQLVALAAYAKQVFLTSNFPNVFRFGTSTIILRLRAIRGDGDALRVL